MQSFPLRGIRVLHPTQYDSTPILMTAEKKKRYPGCLAHAVIGKLNSVVANQRQPKYIHKIFYSFGANRGLLLYIPGIYQGGVKLRCNTCTHQAFWCQGEGEVDVPGGGRAVGGLESIFYLSRTLGVAIATCGESRCGVASNRRARREVDVPRGDGGGEEGKGVFFSCHCS